MTPFSRSLLGFLILAVLVACGTTTPTSDTKLIATQVSQSAPGVDESVEHTPTVIALPSVTRFPTATPNQTQTAISQAIVSTQRAEQTLIAQFPRICDSTYAPPKFSPNKLWMEELCYSDADQNTILTLSNRDSQVIWKLTYRDYMQSPENFPDGGLAVIHWTLNGQYVYFASFTGGDGGECFVGGKIINNGKGLFRFDLQNGEVTTMLPLQENFRSYDFSFSPTDRRLVYGSRSLGLKVLDIQTGQLIDIHPVSIYNSDGGYFWSPDGLMFLYSTVFYISDGTVVSYSLRLVDAQTGSTGR